MISVYDILEQLQSVSSSNEKVEIIKSNKNNETFLKVLRAALDPNTQYYIRKFLLPTENSDTLSLEEALLEFNKLSSRQVTGHAALNHLNYVLSNVSKENSSVLSKVIKQDLRCGVGIKLVNKAIPKLIKTYPILLASDLSEKTLKNLAYPCYSQIKSDGMRSNFFYVNDYVYVMSRSGKFIELKGHFDEVIREIGREYGRDCVIDGELLVLTKNGKFLTRKKGNGILNKAIVKEIPDNELKRVRAKVWDIIPLEDFNKGIYVVPYRHRLDELGSLLHNKSIANGDLIEEIDWKLVYSYEEAIEHYEESLLNGEEGVILKNTHSPWENKRSKHLIKIKAEKECDLVVVDWNEGDKKYTGMLGALVCESSCGKLKVNIGSGYTDEQRKTFDRSLIGRIITAKYNEKILSKDKQTKSLYLPRFIELREDKDTANSEDEIT